jgi:hypothetical protein
MAYSSAYTSGNGWGNGCEEGSRAVLNQSQKGNGSNDVLGVGKHIDESGLERLLFLKSEE